MKQGMLRKLCAVVVFALASSASAHFKMMSPTEWLVTDGYGDPQKTGQCGAASGSLSNAVTTVVAGSKLHVKWVETVLHPGHFRIAIAADRAQFTDPVVTTQNGNCISAAVQSPVIAPVLVDGLFEHSRAAPNNTYETDITVPSTPCEHCTLQVVQFMSAHTAPCIYYHCADLRIVSADAGVPLPVDGGSVQVDAGFSSGGGDAGQGGGSGGGTTQPGCQSVDGLMVVGAALLALAVGRVSGRRRGRGSRL